VLLLSILPFFRVQAAPEPTGWSKPRPTTDQLFNETLGNATVSADGQTALTLGVRADKFYSAGAEINDHLAFEVDVAATTREGIEYEWSTPLYGFSFANANQTCVKPIEQKTTSLK
jgi:hypothetical protein